MRLRPGALCRSELPSSRCGCARRSYKSLPRPGRPLPGAGRDAPPPAPRPGLATPSSRSRPWPATGRGGGRGGRGPRSGTGVGRRGLALLDRRGGASVSEGGILIRHPRTGVACRTGEAREPTAGPLHTHRPALVNGARPPLPPDMVGIGVAARRASASGGKTHTGQTYIRAPSERRKEGSETSGPPGQDPPCHLRVHGGGDAVALTNRGLRNGTPDRRETLLGSFLSTTGVHESPPETR